MKKKAEHIALIGLLGALALVLGILENLLPPLPGMPPGAKAGLSNLVTMFAAGAIGLPAALFIAAIKGLFAFLTRGVSAGLMSLCGGLLSTLIMGILWKKTKFTPVFIGVCGAFGHNLAQLLVTMKGLPLAYNKDLQEDKEGAMDAADTLEDCYVCAAGMIATMTVNADAMATQAKKGYLAATDVADYLAKKGLPFRKAHEIVGHLVLLCDKRGCDLDDLSLEDFKEASDLFEADITEALDLESIVAARTTYGGTGNSVVAEQIELGAAKLAEDKKLVE